MTDATEQEQKRPLTLARPGGRLELRKGVETGQVRQSFSHGRSKTVTVEVRKKRVIGPGTAEVGRAETTPMVGHEPLTTPRPPAAEPARRPVVIPRARGRRKGEPVECARSRMPIRLTRKRAAAPRSSRPTGGARRRNGPRRKVSGAPKRKRA